MDGKKSIRKSQRNYPVKKSIRIVKAKRAKLDLKENLAW
jgi:hypothetical protein